MHKIRLLLAGAVVVLAALSMASALGPSQPQTTAEPMIVAQMPCDSNIFGDVNSSHGVDAADALMILRYVAALPLPEGTLTCPADPDCDGEIDAVDALKVLRHIAALPVNQEEPCPDIGSTLGAPPRPMAVRGLTLDNR